MLPAWLSLLLLNFPGLIDECLIMCGFVYWVGPQDVFYSLKHGYVQWVAPKVEPLIEQYLGTTVGQSKDKKDK